MPKPNTKRSDTFTVICRWHPPGDACEPWQFLAVVIARYTDAQDAANNACLYLIGTGKAWQSRGW